MTDLVKRLREPLVSDAFGRHNIASSLLAERLICDRQDAAQAIEELTAALKRCHDALSSCYQVCDYPANGNTEQDHAMLNADYVLTKYDPKEPSNGG